MLNSLHALAPDSIQFLLGSDELGVSLLLLLFGEIELGLKKLDGGSQGGALSEQRARREAKVSSSSFSLLTGSSEQDETR